MHFSASYIPATGRDWPISKTRDTTDKSMGAFWQDTAKKRVANHLRQLLRMFSLPKISYQCVHVVLGLLDEGERPHQSIGLSSTLYPRWSKHHVPIYAQRADVIQGVWPLGSTKVKTKDYSHTADPKPMECFYRSSFQTGSIWQFCIDYYQLIAITIQEKHLILEIDECKDPLDSTTWIRILAGSSSQVIPWQTSRFRVSIALAGLDAWPYASPTHSFHLSARWIFYWVDSTDKHALYIWTT